MEVSRFIEKLNKVDGNVYVIEEEVHPVDGVYVAELKHDNINLKTLSVYTGSKLTGEKITNYALSTPSLTPWKRIISIYTGAKTVYISYETDGDTVESEDINRVQDAVVSTQESLNQEADRAQAAEAKIAADLAAEVVRATDREQELDDGLKAESTRAQQAEQQLGRDISAESARAKAEENLLTDNLATESARATRRENAIETALNEESARAKKAEKANADAIMVESARATVAEEKLTTDLSTEVTRAKAAETKLTNDLSAEVTRATAAESKLTTDLNSEVTRATASENKLTTDLNSEVTRATASENKLTADLSAEVTRAKAAEKVNADAITAEESRATSAESKLTTDLSAEVTRATEAETKLTSDLSAEITRAKAAEKVNANAITAEANRATTAENKLTSDLSSEITRAKAAEKKNADAITAEASRAIAVETKLTSDLNSEVTRATAAEKKNADAISAEATRAKAAEKTNADLSFRKLGEVSSNTDWNTLTTPGCYKVQTTAFGSVAINHAPNEFYASIYTFGLLLVFKSNIAGEDRTLQVYFPHSGANDYTGAVVSRISNSGTWTKWGPVFRGVSKDYVGLGNVPNVATNDQTPTFTQASALTNIASGEKLTLVLGKISKAIADLITHVGDTVKHITAAERTNWNDANSKKHIHTNKSVLDGITSALITAWNNAVTHISNKSNPHSVSCSQIGALPLSGGTVTDTLRLNKGGSDFTNIPQAQLYGVMGANDAWRIAVGASASDAGWVEFATIDNGNEQIYIRQYNGSGLLHQITLMDAAGNQEFNAVNSKKLVLQNTDSTASPLLTLSGRTAAGQIYGTATPRIRFSNVTDSQSLELQYTDYDSVRVPAGITLVGEQGGEWFQAPKIYADTFTGPLNGNAGTATALQTARTINGTAFNGSANITTANWGTARTLTIGNSSKSVNGSANVSWSLSEIGAATSGHSHAYLPLSGGTMSAAISSSVVTTTHLEGNKGRAIINSTAGAGSYTMLVKMNSSNGYFTEGSWQDRYILQYTAKSTVDANTNAVTKTVTLLNEAGNASFPGTVSAPTFYGALNGNANTATKATQDSAGQQINTTYIKGLSASGRTITVTKGNGSTSTITTQDTTYSPATPSAPGLMSAADKSKLDGITSGANSYTHPTTSGYEHIPSGGASGQILRWSADGTAVWGADNNTTYSNFKGATASAAGGTGLVPAPAAGSHTKYLRADGTWQTPPDTNTWRGIQNNLTSSSTTDSLSAAQGKALKALIDGKAAVSHGRHVPDTCTSVTDWNSAVTTGWYMASGVTNAPASGWFYGEVIAHNVNYVRQILYRFANDANVSGSNCDRYERIRHNSTWGSWYNTSVKTAVPTNAKFTDTWRGIQNNLTSSSTTDSLSAAQGKALKSLVDGKLPLSGGTMQTDAQIILTNGISDPVDTASTKISPGYISTAESGTNGVIKTHELQMAAVYSVDGTSVSFECPVDVVSDMRIYGDISVGILEASTAVSMGRKSGTKVGDKSFACGHDVEASGRWAHAEGNSTHAESCAHAEGYMTVASGFSAHAEGGNDQDYSWTADDGTYVYGSVASRSCAHAEGDATYAGQTAAHAEGSYTQALGIGSHAEGIRTKASDHASHSEGYFTAAFAGSAHAEGYWTIAANQSSHAGGKYNADMITGGQPNNTTGTAFVIGNGISEPGRSNAFSIMYTGVVKAKSTITGSTTADYAEFFEWADGNPTYEDRVGHFVTLDGDKIRYANEDDDFILGIVSGEPFVLGNGDCDTWNGMFLRDEFNRTKYERAPKMELNKETGKMEEVKGADGNPVYYGTRPVLNPNYDPNEPYVPRSDRPEWSPVGMLGVLSVFDDGTCQVNGYCKCGPDGIAKAANTGYRVIQRVTDRIIKVVFK